MSRFYGSVCIAWLHRLQNGRNTSNALAWDAIFIARR